MKHLNDILESIFDIEDNTDQTIIDSIHKFIKDNYDVKSYTISKEPIDGKYIVNTKYDICIRNKNITSLTNGAFRWDEVGGDFYCSHCNFLKSLEGAPKKVKCNFGCSFCKSLKTLKGAPKGVGEIFSCSWCKSLTSLEGAPEEVGDGFICSDCHSLKSLEGAPKKVGGIFSCNDCDSLTSLKGAPKQVGGDFYCRGCTSIKDKTIDSKVRGEIYF